MPSRYVREAAIRSKAVNSLSWQGEVFWRRILNLADDFGRYTADPELLRSDVFPRQLDRVRETDIPRLLAECETAGLLFVYSAGSKSFLVMNQWEQGRAKNSSYPPPPPDICSRLQTHVYTCKQMPPTPTPTPTPTRTPSPPLINLTISRPQGDSKGGNGAVEGRGSRVEGKENQTPDARRQTPAPADVLSMMSLDRVAGEIMANDWRWFYDNCKVPITDLTQASLMTVLKPFVGRVTESDLRAAFCEAVRRAHAAAVDGMVKTNTAGYAIKCFRELLEKHLTTEKHP